MEYPSPAGRRPGAFSPVPTASNAAPHLQARALHQRSHSSGSDSSGSSQLTAMSGGRRTPYQQRPPIFGNPSANSSSTSLHNQHLSIAHVVNDAPSRKNSPLNPTAVEARSHKRNNSQGFFEPSLPSASLVDQSGMSGLTASQIAAQAAMQQQNANNSHSRKRSQTVPSPLTSPEANNGRPKPPPLPTIQSAIQPSSARKPDGRFPMNTHAQYQSMATPSPTVAATSAANAAYPRNMQLSPGLTSFSELPTEKEGKSKTERSKMKLFSKPKHIGIPGYKDMDRKEKLIPSPGRGASPGPSLLSNKFNQSTTSLVDSTTPASASLYSLANSSTSTLVPRTEDKEKSHRHNFLSRQKNKFKDKIDDHSTLALSSASSNSKPVDPNAPQSIYSFAPSSPGVAQSSFSKSMSGFDLRHGGRALREKRREEKAAANPDLKKIDPSSDWLAASGLTPAGVTSTPAFPPALDHSYGNLQGFGLSNMTADDAWDFLKAKILIIFEGEELKMPVEDLNRLVGIHIQRCFSKLSPTIITDDLDDLLRTGFLSLDQTIRSVPDDKLVPYLVEMWLFVFGVILPYIQAVFLPLDLEFKGQGTMVRDPTEFWGVPPSASDPTTSPSSALEDFELDVRRLVLLSFRDNIILPRHENLKAIFSRLSLESINVVGLESPQPPHSPFGGRPGTAGSSSGGDGVSTSYNSQSSTLLGGDSSGGARSRATSNTSNPDIPSFSPPLRRHGLTNGTSTSSITLAGSAAGGAMAGATARQQGGAQVTETVGRMLQCMSVLASLRSGDEAQETIEEITKALKINWLGRGRTGRNRKGFIGGRVGVGGLGGRVKRL